jgi:hypothetical protein
MQEESTAMLQFPGTQQIGIFVAITFVQGIVLIFLYAGLRPRFGAGAKTAVIAALIMWIVVMMGAVTDVVIGLTPANLVALAGAWSLVETIVGAVAGAWVYKESA